MTKSAELEATLRDVTALAATRGSSWARALAEDLRLSGRRACGGWPGTLSEARSRAELLMAELSPVGPDVTREEVARLLYAAARSDWLRLRDNEPREGGS
ncbi:MAG: hypothetical protein IT378_22425 [Sandaracinaceae bacterium]|nr:hypothetical protein [Sandaracinaceae bacterium]